jgi:hypothetical protein
MTFLICLVLMVAQTALRSCGLPILKNFFVPVIRAMMTRVLLRVHRQRHGLRCRQGVIIRADSFDDLVGAASHVVVFWMSKRNANDRARR